MRLLWRLLAAILAYAAPAAAQSATRRDEEAAKAHFLAGSAYYEQANYADAVKEFNEAYRLSQAPRPPLQHQRLLRAARPWDDAIASLQQYLTERPDAPDRASHRDAHRQLRGAPRRRSARSRRRRMPPPTNRAAAGGRAGAAPPRGELDPRRHRRRPAARPRSAPASRAPDLQRSRHRSAAAQVCHGGDQTLRDEADFGQALTISTDVLLGVGGAAVITGVVLFIVEARKPRTRRLGRRARCSSEALRRVSAACSAAPRSRLQCRLQRRSLSVPSMPRQPFGAMCDRNRPDRPAWRRPARCARSCASISSTENGDRTHLHPRPAPGAERVHRLSRRQLRAASADADAELCVPNCNLPRSTPCRQGSTCCNDLGRVTTRRRPLRPVPGCCNARAGLRSFAREIRLRQGARASACPRSITARPRACRCARSKSRNCAGPTGSRCRSSARDFAAAICRPSSSNIRRRCRRSRRCPASSATRSSAA